MSNELTAVYFMWKREIIRFFRSKSRLIGSFGMPFFFLAIVGSGLGGAFNLPGMQGNYMGFIAPGIIGMVVLFGSIFSGVMVIMDRQFGFLKETMVAPVSRTSIVIGKAIGGATTAVIQGIIMIFIAMILGVNIMLSAIPLAIAFMFFISVAFVLLGIAIASTMEDMHGFQLVMNLLVMPLFFLSGAIFPLSGAPEIIRYLAYIDPLTYAVEALRHLLIGYSEVSLGVSAAVIGVFLLISGTAAVYLFNRIES